MTSDATHEATRKLLEDNGNFGMAEGQITLMRQAKVPALADNDARIAVEADDPCVAAPHLACGWLRADHAFMCVVQLHDSCEATRTRGRVSKIRKIIGDAGNVSTDRARQRER